MSCAVSPRTCSTLWKGGMLCHDEGEFPGHLQLSLYTFCQFQCFFQLFLSGQRFC